MRYLYETERPLTDRLSGNIYAIRGSAVHKCIENNLSKIEISRKEIFDELGLLLERYICRSLDNEILKAVYSNWGLSALFDRQTLINLSHYVYECCHRLNSYVEKRHLNGVSFAETAPKLGSEQNLLSLKYDLAGKPDFTFLDETGVCHVVDFKTGRIKDDNGEPLESYLLQLAAYAVILKDELKTSRLVLEIISTEEQISCNFDSSLEMKVQRLIQKGRDVLFDRSVDSSSDAAVGGEHCFSCSYRPSCYRYLNEFETIHGLNPKKNSDLFGEVIAVDNESVFGRIRISDHTGRNHQVIGVPFELCHKIRIGSFIKIFGIKSIDISGSGKVPVNHYMVDVTNPSKSAFECVIVV